MKKIVLRDDEMPTRWYNVVPDIPGGLLPPLDPQTHQPISPEKLAAVFPMGLLEQEMSQERFIDIPPEVQEVYSIWRPSVRRVPALLQCFCGAGPPLARRSIDGSVPETVFHTVHLRNTQDDSALSRAAVLRIFASRASSPVKPTTCSRISRGETPGCP